MRTRIYAAGVTASIVAQFGGLLVPENPLFSPARVFSSEARPPRRFMRGLIPKVIATDRCEPIRAFRWR